MKLVRLNKSDDSWDRLESDWSEQCAKYEEDFSSYSEASLGTLRDECDEGSVDKNAEVFALEDPSENFHAACFLNITHLKGFSGKVLRVRHLVLSPYYDFEDLDLEQYASTLGNYFLALVDCSDTVLPSNHIKLH